MPYPLTHFLWGYMISRSSTRDKDLIIVGSAAAVVMDIPWLFDLDDFHRDSTHFLSYILFMMIVLALYSREWKVPSIVGGSMFVHLVLDAAATRGGIVWFAPFSDWTYGYSGPHDLALFILLNVFISGIPTVVIAFWILSGRDRPWDIARYLWKRYVIKK